MYAGTANQAAGLQEDFLLGKRRIDAPSADEAPKPKKQMTKDIEAKIREDPLFSIKRREREIVKRLKKDSNKYPGT